MDRNAWKCDARVETFEDSDGVVRFIGAVVFPLRIDLPDILHIDPPEHRVCLPHPECALCQVGLCVQKVEPPDFDVVVHARWSDG